MVVNKINVEDIQALFDYNKIQWSRISMQTATRKAKKGLYILVRSEDGLFVDGLFSSRYYNYDYCQDGKYTTFFIPVNLKI